MSSAYLLACLSCMTLLAPLLVAYNFPAPPGEHPRILVTQDELPELRARLEGEQGQRLLEALRQQAQRFVRDFDKAFPKDGTPATEELADLVNRLRTGQVKYFEDAPYNAGLLATLTDDPEHRRWAVNYLRAWLMALAPDGKVEVGQGWGNPRLALAYDFIHRDLTDAERQLARDLIVAQGLTPAAQANLRNQWYVWGPNRGNGSHSNWDCIYASNTLVSLMAIEGEPTTQPVAEHAVDNSVKVLRSFLLDGITPDGAFFDGVTYPHGYGTHFMPHAIIGLEKRGLDATSGTNLERSGLWLTYEMLPWGGEGQPMNKSDGNYSSQTMFPTWLTARGAPMMGWHYRNTSGIAHGMAPRVSAELAIIAGMPGAGEWTPAELPLSHWFSVVGKVISRGGWGPLDSHFILSTNPISTGHSHADQGTICFADLGVNFFADSSTTRYTTDEHNLVLIDGLGQARVEGSTEGFIPHADLSTYADAAEADLEESYSRVIVGALDGPWHFENYNPVQTAQRRSLFIRGATGTILAIADDLQKDDEPRAYEWRMHSEVNNRLSVDGRRFTMSERYGGPLLQSAGRGQQVTLVREEVPAGRYRCWALVRGLPHIGRNWSNTTVAINGKKVLYNSTYFALGGFSAGWRWNEIRVGGHGSDPWMELPAGKLEVEMTGATGAQVALFVFATDENWNPAFDIPSHGQEGFLVLGPEQAVQGEQPWALLDDPQAELHGIFLGRETPELAVDNSRLTGQPRILASRESIRWQSVCVAAAHQLTNPRELELLDPHTVRFTRGEDVDLVSTGDLGRLAGEELETDGRLASAALPGGTLAHYALQDGQRLLHAGRKLVSGDTAVTVINDGSTLVVRGPGGATLQAARLGAAKLRINGQEAPLPAGDPIAITIPMLPDEWQIATRDDGRVVTVEGDGPWPLKILAPEARELIVNGVRRHFIRSERQGDEGLIWPYMRWMACWRYAGEEGPEMLQSWVRSGEAEIATIPNSTEQALRLERGARLEIPLSGPAEYDMMLSIHALGETELLLRVGDAPRAWQVREAGRAIKTFTGFSFTGASGELVLLATQPFYLKGVLMKPKLSLLTPETWAIIGPFQARSQASDEIREDMATPYIPEDGSFDATAAFAGRDGAELRWVQGASLPDANDYRRSMWSKQLGFQNQGITYSVTVIESPTDRQAELGIMVDYWANAWLNGEPLVSERVQRHVDRDGCAFNDTLVRAPLHLRKGRNILMIKVRGGNGSNAFSGYITNPGDLTIRSPLQ